jgi:endo-1,4-beta-xylanase
VFISASWNAVSDPSGILRYEWRDTTIAPPGQRAFGQTVFLVDTFAVAKPPINSRHDHEFKVRAVDGAGNVGQYSAAKRWGLVTQDTLAPGVPGGVTLDTLIRVSGGSPPLRVLASARNFLIGAAVRDTALAREPLYRQTLATHYNSVVPEDATDFWPIHPHQNTYAFSRADSIVDFAQANGMAFHGHTLVWYSWNPTWLLNGGFTNDQVRAILKDHITTVVGRYKGKAVSWDVVNEPMENDGTLHASFWKDRLGPEYIDSAFIWADRADPAAKLYLNEWGVETINAKSTGLLNLAIALRARGIPIDGVGIQTHLLHFGPPPSSAQMQANLIRFANAGFDIRITEMDSDIADTAGASALVAQALAYRDALDACLRTPRCLEFTTWGFTDKYHWLTRGDFPGWGRALPFDASYQPKPAYDSLLARLGRP